MSAPEDVSSSLLLDATTDLIVSIFDRRDHGPRLPHDADIDRDPDRLSKTISQLSTALQECSKNITFYENFVTSLVEERDRLQERALSAEAAVEKLTEKCEGYERDVKELTARSREYQRKFTTTRRQLHSQLTTCRDELARCTSELARREKELDPELQVVDEGRSPCLEKEGSRALIIRLPPRRSG